MKIYILTDLEGIAMVSRFSQTREEGPQKETAMGLLTQELNAAVDGILDVDADAEIVVWDGHGTGGIDVLEFHPQAKLIARGPIRPPYYLDATYNALFFLGQHAMAGTPNAPLSHTYSSLSIEYYKLNGKEIGEFGCRAALGRHFRCSNGFSSPVTIRRLPKRNNSYPTFMVSKPNRDSDRNLRCIYHHTGREH